MVERGGQLVNADFEFFGQINEQRSYPYADQRSVSTSEPRCEGASSSRRHNATVPVVVEHRAGGLGAHVGVRSRPLHITTMVRA